MPRQIVLPVTCGRAAAGGDHLDGLRWRLETLRDLRVANCVTDRVKATRVRTILVTSFVTTSCILRAGHERVTQRKRRNATYRRLLSGRRACSGRRPLLVAVDARTRRARTLHTRTVTQQRCCMRDNRLATNCSRTRARGTRVLCSVQLDYRSTRRRRCLSITSATATVPSKPMRALCNRVT